jgi:hypothetical protein
MCKFIKTWREKGFHEEAMFPAAVLAGCKETYENTGMDVAQALDYLTELMEQGADEEGILHAAFELTGIEDDPDEEPFDPVKFLEG